MSSPNGRLLELVQKLDALGPQPSLVHLAQALEACRLTAADVADYVQTNHQGYNRVPVVRREQYELLVMTWLPGQASVPHDHTGSICAMQVVQGEAIEGNYRVAPDGYVDLEYETTVARGEVTSGQDAGVHTVRNRADAGEALVTVHVYAPPLNDFRRFVPRPASPRKHPQELYESPPTIVVVGGGFSGSISAAQILRRAAAAGTALRVVLVERRGALGEGLAYGTRDLAHLLNVPAGRMSAWPDRPDDFVQWVGRHHAPVAPGEFVPRQWYGEYVRDQLLTTAAESGDSARLAVLLDEVRRVARHPSGGWMVHLARGASLRADAVVLAIGHRPPSDPLVNKWSGPRTRFIGDPWRPYAMNVVRPDESVLILGTGLTAVDAVLSLAQPIREAPITMVSRNGLVPHVHATKPLTPASLDKLVSELIATPDGLPARDLVRRFRQTVRELSQAGADWRCVVDGIRPHTARLWQSMPNSERRRFLARLRPWWEVHRHRMAPGVFERFRGLLDAGKVQIVAGRVESVKADDNGAQVVIRPRGNGRTIEQRAGWVINCTGPMPSNNAESNPVIGSLLVHGWLISDALGLGIETTAHGNPYDAEGGAVRDLFVVGTLRKPELWESTAVPELRAQAAAAAERILEFIEHGLRRPTRGDDVSVELATAEFI